jgi:hypothetical protein
MTKSEIEFVKSLKQSDAQKIFSDIRKESNFLGIPFNQSESWASYKQARDLMVQYVRENSETHPLGLSNAELAAISQNTKPMLSLENLRFAFYANKVKHEYGL